MSFYKRLYSFIRSFVRSLIHSPTHLLQVRVTGGRSPSQQLRVPGGNQAWTEAAPGTETGTQGTATHRTCTALGCGRKPSPQRNSHSPGGRSQPAHVQHASWDQHFPHQCHKETPLNRRALFRHLPCSPLAHLKLRMQPCEPMGRGGAGGVPPPGPGRGGRQDGGCRGAGPCG